MISLLEIAKGIKEKSSTESYNTKSVGREDGETWDHAKGFAAKHKGEIRYFDINDYPEDMSNDEVNAAAEKDAKAYAKTGKVSNPKDAKKGDGDSEKDDAGKLGGGDFDRDGGDEPDMDSDDAEDDEKSSESENEKIISSLEDMDLDGYNVDSLDSAIDSGQYASITGKDADEPDNEMSVNAFPDEDGVGYAINFGVGHGSIYLSSKEEALEAAQRLLKNDKIRKAMDGESEETLADLHGKEMISVAYGFKESITINGKQYKAIKEDTLNENPAAIAAAQSAVIQAKAGKKVSVNTARQSSYAKKDPAAHKKAKSMWQKIKDRFSKKESMKESKENPNPRVLKENYDRIFRSRK